MAYLAAISTAFRVWRQTALLEPSLWTNIHYLDCAKISNELPQKTKDWICHYLLRAKSSDLSIHIEF